MLIDLNIQSSFPELEDQQRRSLRSHVKKVNEFQYDKTSWLEILRIIRLVTPISDNTRKIYESFFTVFPTAAQQWRQYVEHELQCLEQDRVQEILSRCITKCKNVDLWLLYLQYVRLSKKGLEEEYQAIDYAYQFAIQNIGEDIDSMPIYQDYIAFLTSLPVSTEQERQEQSKLILKVYKNALAVPMKSLETLYTDFLARYDRPGGLLSQPMQQQRGHGQNKEYNIETARKEFLEVNAIALHRRKLYANLPTMSLAVPSHNEETANYNATLWEAWLKIINFE